MTTTDLALLRAPFFTAFLLFFAITLLGAAAMPIDRYRASAERHDQPFDEDRQRARRIVAGAMGAVFLLLTIGVTLI